MWSILGTKEPTAESGGKFTCYYQTLENYSVVENLREDDWKRSCGGGGNTDWTN